MKLKIKLLSIAVLTIFTGVFLIMEAVAWHPAHAHQHIHDAVYHHHGLTVYRA